MTSTILNAVSVKPLFSFFSRKNAEITPPITDVSQLDRRARRAIADLPPYLLRDIGVTDV